MHTSNIELRTQQNIKERKNQTFPCIELFLNTPNLVHKYRKIFLGTAQIQGEA